MKSIVLYFYKKRHSKSHNDSALWVGDDIIGFVRTELHNKKDALYALDAAKPRKGETVLNSVELA